MKRLPPPKRLPDLRRPWLQIVLWHICEPVRLIRFLSGPLLAVMIGSSLALLLAHGI